MCNDRHAPAVYAAGIASALTRVRAADPHEATRAKFIDDNFNGHAGLMEQVAEAAEMMERIRLEHGPSAAWGTDFPYVYDVWDRIANEMWVGLGSDPLEHLVDRAIRSLDDGAARDCC